MPSAESVVGSAAIGVISPWDDRVHHAPLVEDDIDAASEADEERGERHRAELFDVALRRAAHAESSGQSRRHAHQEEYGGELVGEPEPRRAHSGRHPRLTGRTLAHAMRSFIEPVIGPQAAV